MSGRSQSKALQMSRLNIVQSTKSWTFRRMTGSANVNSCTSAEIVNRGAILGGSFLLQRLGAKIFEKKQLLENEEGMQLRKYLGDL